MDHLDPNYRNVDIPPPAIYIIRTNIRGDNDTRNSAILG